MVSLLSGRAGPEVRRVRSSARSVSAESKCCVAAALFKIASRFAVAARADVSPHKLVDVLVDKTHRTIPHGGVDAARMFAPRRSPNGPGSFVFRAGHIRVIWHTIASTGRNCVDRSGGRFRFG